MIITWQQTQALLPLSTNVVHLWCAKLRVEHEKLCYLLDLLTNEEKNRANKFISAANKESFIVSRSILRWLLSKYLEIAPKKLIINVGQYGKPYVALDKITKPPLQFNISHSGDLALFAFTLYNNIGVDIEYIRPNFNYKEIISHFFSKQESIIFAALPEELKLKTFYTCWTRKEAFIKAIGQGLSFPLNGFDVNITTNANDTPLPIYIHSEQDINQMYFLFNLDLTTDYIAAFAIDKLPLQIHKWYLNTEMIK